MIQTSTVFLLAVALSLAMAPGAAVAQPRDLAALNEELWNAARDGDVARVKAALERGADMNSGNRYKTGALFFAADKGHTEVIKLLLDRGADINAQDTFYKFRPIMMALFNGHSDAVALLLQRGSEGAGTVLVQGARQGNKQLVDAALASKSLTRADVQGALAAARRGKGTAIATALETKLAEFPADPAVKVDPAVLKSYVGVVLKQRRDCNGRACGRSAHAQKPGSWSFITWSRTRQVEGRPLRMLSYAVATHNQQGAELFFGRGDPMLGRKPRAVFWTPSNSGQTEFGSGREPPTRHLGW